MIGTSKRFFYPRVFRTTELTFQHSHSLLGTYRHAGSGDRENLETQSHCDIPAPIAHAVYAPRILLILRVTPFRYASSKCTILAMA